MTGQLLVWGALALAAGGLWWVRRRQDAAAARGVLGAIRLGPSHVLYVVEIGGRRLLVGTGPAGAPGLVADLSHDPASVPNSAPSADLGRVGCDSTRTRAGEEAA